jgi:hypothetical protein
MTQPVNVEELAEAMYRLVKETVGVKKLRPLDLTKKMIEHFSPERCTKDACKEALRLLMDSGRCVYTFYGGTSYVELPPKEEGAG